jgi:S1-C subfamily serine protease
LRGQVSGLADALRASRAEVSTLRTDVGRATAAGDASRTAVLKARLRVAADALRGQQRAASLDFSRIEQANRHAVAMLYVEYEDGQVATATAFAVTPDGILLTNRHAVLGPNGQEKPRRIGIQFSDSEQVWPAHLLAVDNVADLAALRVTNIVGDVPTVRAFNLRADTLASEAPVALIGFPLGGAAPTFVGGKRVVRPLLGAGILVGEHADTLQLQGYGAAGASGTPVFDASGDVVGVLFGGRKDGAIQTLYAVPAPAAARLVAGLTRVSSP